jgi:hypothetical protein
MGSRWPNQRKVNERTDICTQSDDRRRTGSKEGFKQGEADKAMTEHDKAQTAFHENRERLKAERLAREAGAKAEKMIERPVAAE